MNKVVIDVQIAVIMDALKKEKTQVAKLATAWLIKDKNNFLLFKRNSKNGFGEWALPGGKMDTTDETVYHGAIRELKEETGIDDVIIYESSFPVFTKSPLEAYVTFIFILEVADVQALMDIIKSLNVVNDEGELCDVKIVPNSEMRNISNSNTTFKYTKAALISYLSGNTKILSFDIC